MLNSEGRTGREERQRVVVERGETSLFFLRCSPRLQETPVNRGPHESPRVAPSQPMPRQNEGRMSHILDIHGSTAVSGYSLWGACRWMKDKAHALMPVIYFILENFRRDFSSRRRQLSSSNRSILCLLSAQAISDRYCNVHCYHLPFAAMKLSYIRVFFCKANSSECPLALL